MRVLSELRRILAVAAATLLLTWLVGNLLTMGVGLARSRVVAADVSAVLDRIVPSAIVAQDELAASAGREPERRWIEQDCSFTSDDSGWVAIRHRETCVLRTVSAWQVGSEREARALLPVREVARSSHRGCVTLGPVGDVGVVESPEASYVDSRGPGGDPFCTSGLDDPQGARELVGQRRTIGSGRWLVVVAEQPLVDVPIGCARWSVVFCDNPWVVHAYGDWP